MKRKKPKFFFQSSKDSSNYQQQIDIAFALKMPFIIKQSNYTFEIESVERKADGTPLHNIQFIQNVMSTDALVTAAIIEKHIKEKESEMNELDEPLFVRPQINLRNLRFNKFEHTEKIQAIKQDEIFCVDIKSAYLQVLYNLKLIPKNCYEKTQLLSKKDRLAAVGMLASNKFIKLHDEEGRAVWMGNEKKEMAVYFFLCVMEVNEVMEEMRQLLGNDFIFFWVDGIYFKTEENGAKLLQYLIDRDYKATFNKMVNFKVKEYKSRFWLSYWEQKIDRCINKKFCIPKEDMSHNKKIIEILGLHDQKHSIIKTILK